MNFNASPGVRQEGAQRFTCAICKRQSTGRSLSVPVPVPAGMPRIRVPICPSHGWQSRDWRYRRAVGPLLKDWAARVLRERVADRLGLPAGVFEGTNGTDQAAAAAGLPRERVADAVGEVMGSGAA